MQPIAILTDFGTRDWYVASMKGIMMKIAPNTPHVDITHHVPMGDVTRAGFILEQCYREYPEGSVFLTVVDPGVGTARKAIAVAHEGYYFVAPDNGVLGFLWRENRGSAQVREITNAFFTKELRGHTFHGRDIFAPVAAHLASGQPFDKIGPEIEKPQALPVTTPELKRKKALATITFIDHYGNLITNIRKERWLEEYPETFSIVYKKQAIPLTDTFGDVPKGNITAYFGSGGFLEIAINGGNAAQSLGLLPGSDIKLKVFRKEDTEEAD